MKHALLISAALLVGGSAVFYGICWINTQPVKVVETEPGRSDLPETNQKILDYIEANGKALAPTYKQVVCTEFVIKVLEQFEPVSNEMKKDVRIITTKELGQLIKSDSPVIRGIQTALMNSKKGREINVHDVRPGDFVQFWNFFQGEEYGHCGVVLEIVPHESLTLYSSHPVTEGYGKQKYVWPDKLYFARLE